MICGARFMVCGGKFIIRKMRFINLVFPRMLPATRERVGRKYQSDGM